ncbi:MAG: LacI family DNA-binding transcriptional regulator [Roseiarcus sp.]|uniref:LacI family DNA-binding transcriptional regulator n=1 Tax=Roseiarcus sp. TaxID=1969460 RepID=UPI003C3A03A2
MGRRPSRSGNPKPASAGETPPPRGRARLAQVAQLAGVGIATVDRVLNERGSVAPETTRKVIDAARQLKLGRSLPIAYRRGLRLEVIMARPDLPLFQRLNRAFVDAASTLDRSVIVQRSFIDEAKPQLAAERILATQADAVILYGQELPSVIDAVTSITVGGKPVVTLCSDLPTSPRLAYVGIDHYSAGRTAAYFMTRMTRRQGPVIVLTHCLDYRAHAERIGGFRDWLSEHKADLSVACILEGREAPDLSERLLTEALLGYADAIGVYNTSDANVAVKQALQTTGRTGDIVFIGHELDAHTRRLLADGTMALTIDQNPERQARAALDTLLARFGYAEKMRFPESSNDVPFSIYGPENVRSRKLVK